MITDCPDLKEVSDFHFLQLRTLRLIKENERIPSKQLNVIATASKYGILFVGIEGGFKVLKLEDILNIDDDKENRSIEGNYTSTFVPSPTPALLSLNASQKTLVLCSESTTGAVTSFYNVADFANKGSSWQPYVTASAQSGCGWSDFVWNPAVEGLYAYCLSDGSIHVEELNGPQLNPVAALPNANATSICWSPKGKQLVVGRSDGTFAQYKPTLQEVKSVLPPPLEDSPVKVTSICWISNMSFAVVYVAADTPYLFMVTTSKDSPVSYTNFYDVCLGNNSGPNQKYFLHLEPQWGILLCASVDSIEIAVLGDMPNWVQWDLKEDGKALLPGKDGATHAIGSAVMYSATRQIIISESESYPPMPVVFFVTNNGLLVSFHMINTNTQAASLVSPPVTMETKGSSTTEAGRMVLKRSSSSSVHPTVSSSSALSMVSAPSVANSTFQPVAASPIQPPLSATFNVGSKPDLSPMQQKVTHQNSVFQVSPADVGKNSFNSEKEKPATILSRPWEGSSISQSRPEKIPAASQSPLSLCTEKPNEIQSSRDFSYMTAILTEIQSFNKELQDLKQLQSMAPCMDGEEDMAALKVFALNLHNFQKDISETMQSLSSDIFTLKNILLESFVMVEEACSKLRRRNDHSYITMLKERALDPITAKRMQKINQHYQYLSTQLQELNNKLDQDWINLLARDKKLLRKNPSISSTEAIYKTIVNNQKIIHNLRRTVDKLSAKSEEKKLRGISKSGNWSGYNKRSTMEDLSKLADEFLQVKVTSQEEKETPINKRLSSESQNFLKEYLKDSPVVTVRPTAVYSPSQSRLLSNAMPSGDSALSDIRKKKGESPQQVSTTTKEDTISVVPSISEIPGPKTPPIRLPMTPENRNESYAPVYEAITPPESFPVEMINKIPSNNIVGSSVLKEKNTVAPAFKSGITITSTPDVSAFKQKDFKIQGPTTSLLPSAKNTIDNHPTIPLSAESKILSKGSLETVAPTSSPTSIFPKTLSFTSAAPKNVENPPLKFFTGVNNTPFSFSVKNSQQNFAEQKKESDIPQSQSPSVDSKAATVTSIAPVSMQEVRNPASSEGLVCQQPETLVAPKSNSFSSLSFEQSTPFLASGAKTNIFLHFSLPESKDQPVSSVVTSSVSQMKNSTAFLFEPTIGKPPSTMSVNSSNVSFTNKDETSDSNTTIQIETSSVDSSSPDKVIVVDVKSSSKPQVLNVEGGELKSGTLNKLSGDSSLLSQLMITPVQKTESSVVTTSSQGSGTVSFGDLSGIKQAISMAESNKSSQMPLITSVSSVAVGSTEVKSGTPPPSPAVPATASSPAPVVTSITSSVSQPDSATTAATVISTLLAQTTTSPASPPMFGQNVPVTSTADSTTSAPSFGFQSPPLFGQATTGASSFFAAAKPETGSLFGQAVVTQSGSTFGQPQVTSSGFGGTSGGFFSQTPSFGAANTTSNPDPNSQTSAFSFGKSTFGQQASGSFGLAKSLFGQNTTASFTQPASPSSSFSFGQSPSSNNGSIFGQGSFFSGLGGKPSEENANKNVFGLNSAIKPTADTNLFGNSGPSTFGSKGGSFSGGGSFSSGGGSVAQSGFGSFQQNTPQKPGGFGAAPAFGGAPTFGSPPAFGSPPSFGSGNALSSVFGQQQQQQQQQQQPQANFSNFASASTPTFGALASQTSGFGSPNPMAGGGGFGTQSSAFGAAASPFGGSSFGSQPAGFGSPSSPPTKSSAFTQWRN